MKFSELKEDDLGDEAPLDRKSSVLSIKIKNNLWTFPIYRIIISGMMLFGLITLLLIGFANKPSEQNSLPQQMHPLPVDQKKQTNNIKTESGHPKQVFEIPNTYDISIKADPNANISQYEYYSTILKNLITIKIFSSQSDAICSLLYIKPQSNSTNRANSIIQQINSDYQSYQNETRKNSMIYQFAALPQLSQKKIQSALKSVIQEGIKIQITKNLVNAQYTFIRTPIISSSCQWICYNCLASQKMMKNQTALLIFSGNKEIDLKRVDLENLTIQSLSTFSFLFSNKLLEIITPLNFAYNNFYTYQELLLYPMLALLQTTKLMKSTYQLKARIKSINFENPQYELSSLKEQKSHVCFLGFPTDPYSNNISQIEAYLSKLPQSQPQFPVSFIISILYSPQISAQVQSLFNKISAIKKHQKGVEIKFRIRKNQIESGLQVYDSAFSYCPFNSVIFSSRFNIVPNYAQIVKEVQKRSLCTSIKDEKGQKIMLKIIIPNYIKENGEKSQLQMPIPDQSKLHHKYERQILLNTLQACSDFLLSFEKKISNL